MQQPVRIFLLLVALSVTPACVYKQDIRQGNQFDDEAIAQIETGETTRGQVRFLLGTPIVADPFHGDRWDYVFFHKDGKTGDVKQRRFEIYFENDVVQRIVEVD